MILSGRKDLFRFELPKVFIPAEVKRRWMPYLERQPLSIDDVSGLVNYSVQSITVPNFNFQPVEQVKPGNSERARGTTRSWRASMSPEMLIDRQFTVTMKMLDGYVNYWIMLETFFSYYAFERKEPFLYDMALRITDTEGNVMYTVVFHDALYTGLSEFNLSYNELEADLTTFDASFSFNEMTVRFDEG